MPGIDFSTIVAEPIDFTSRQKKTYTIYDDIPTETIVKAIVAVGTFSDLISLKNTPTDAMEQTYQRAAESVCHAFGEVVRHSNPEVSDDELKGQFRTEDMVQVLTFFTLRAGQSLVKQQQPISEAIKALMAKNQPDLSTLPMS